MGFGGIERSYSLERALTESSSSVDNERLVDKEGGFG